MKPSAGGGIGKAALVLWVWLLGGCVTTWLGGAGGYDERSLTFETVSLFDQRSTGSDGPSWKGDWLFRRYRLSLVDEALRNIKPDVLYLQEMMAKSEGSPDSDRRILAAGSLEDYQWRSDVAQTYEDTWEEESLAIAYSSSLEGVEAEAEHRNFWRMGQDGYLMTALLRFDGQPILAVNVKMPAAASNNDYLWYDFVKSRILERLMDAGVCHKRVVVGGYLPGSEGARRYRNLIQALGLKDTALEFCQLGSQCYTATPVNEIFLLTEGDETPLRTDKILTHQSALVTSASRVFDEPAEAGSYVKSFGLSELWPSKRFGWSAQIRLPRCSQDEMERPLSYLGQAR